MTQTSENRFNPRLKSIIMMVPFFVLGVLGVFGRRKVQRGVGWQDSNASDSDGHPY